MSFGFSVGDIIACCILIQDLIDALQDSGGAAKEYQEVIRELRSFDRVLLQVELLSRTLESSKELNALAAATNQAARHCKQTIEDFLGKLRRHESVHGANSTERFREAYVKIKSQITRKEELFKLRVEVVAHRSSINVLLATASLRLLEFPKRQLQHTKNSSQEISRVFQRPSSVISSISSKIRYFITLGADLKSLVTRILTINVQTYKLLISIQSQIPNQVEVVQNPVMFEDALGRMMPFHLDFITSWDAFDAVLAFNFSKAPGETKVARKEYVLQERSSGKEIPRLRSWKSCFMPGQRICMSMILNTAYETTACPRCRLEVGNSRMEAIECSGCGICFQRIQEVIDLPADENSNIADARSKFSLTTTGSQVSVITNHVSPKDSEAEEEDIRMFKRIRLLHRIVRPSRFSDVRLQNSWAMCEDHLEEHLEEPDAMEIEDSGLDSHENLQLAAYHGNQETVAVILANGTPIDEVGSDEHGGVPVCTALQAATLSGKESVVRFLIELRANINAPAPPGGFGTALYAAVTTMNEPLVEYLLGQGADPNMTSGASVSLLEAVSLGDVKIVQSLLEHGADVNIDVEKGTPLYAAIRSCAKGSQVIVDMLLKSGADVNPSMRIGRATPLQAAAATDSLNIVEILTYHGANVNAEGSPFTALGAASMIGNVKMMCFLIENGAHIQARDNFGKSPLHYAVRAKTSSQPARVLVERGAAVNMRDSSTASTPLHYAVACSNEMVVRLLLEMGADSQIKDNLGRRPQDCGLSAKSDLYIMLDSPGRVLSTPPPEIITSDIVNFNKDPHHLLKRTYNATNSLSFQSSLPSPDASPPPTSYQDTEESGLFLSEMSGSDSSDDCDCEMILYDEVRSIAQNEDRNNQETEVEMQTQTPLPPAKQIIFDYAMTKFNELYDGNCSGTSNAFMGILSCTDDSSSTSANSFSSQNVRTAQNPQSKAKRKRGSAEGDDPDDDKSKKRKKGGDPGQTSNKTISDSAVRFACPYHKHDPQIYTVRDWRSCAASCYNTISRLKEHLYRRHRAPIQCSRCWNIFDKQEKLKAHLRLLDICEVRPPQASLGFGADIEKQLKRRSEWGGQTKVDKWNEIYRIIFPGEALPSPYFVDILDQVAAFASNPRAFDTEGDYLNREIPRLFRERLRGVLHMDLRPQPDQQGYENSIPAMLDSCLQDSRLTFRALIASDQDLHPRVSPTNNRPPMPAISNSHIATILPGNFLLENQSAISDNLPQSAYGTPALFHRSHSIGPKYSNGQPARGHFVVAEQGSFSDSGYMGHGPMQDLSLDNDAFLNFRMENTNDYTKLTMFDQPADFMDSGDWNNDSIPVDGQEDPNDQLKRSDPLQFDFS